MPPIEEWIAVISPAVWWGMGAILGLILLFRLLVYWVRRRKKDADLRRIIRESGVHGEEMTVRRLRKIRGRKRILRNLYLPKGKQGGTVEVDAVMVTQDGIFVVETKNYSGVIVGDEEDRYWRHEFRDREGGFNFYNPIKQNAGHVKALRTVLEMEVDAPIYSVLVFGDRSRLDRVRVPTAAVSITRISGLPRTIRRLASGTRGVFSNEDVDYIYERLRVYTHADAKIKKEHLRAIEREKRNR